MAREYLRELSMRRTLGWLTARRILALILMITHSEICSCKVKQLGSCQPDPLNLNEQKGL